MAKKKATRVIPFVAPPVEGEPLVVLEPPVAVANVTYAFSTKSRCPKCGTLATRSTSTQVDTQYRRCLRPSCRENYKEVGRPLDRLTRL